MKMRKRLLVSARLAAAARASVNVPSVGTMKSYRALVTAGFSLVVKLKVMSLWMALSVKSATEPAARAKVYSVA